MHLRLESFDGPLDLLLHLIKAQELNIFNIPIVMITEQYLGFLKQVPELDFLTAGEYLAMAAQLIEIKANLLVPVLQNKQETEAENLAEVTEEDPRKVLVEQLLEFEAYKKASEVLQQLNSVAQDHFPSAEYKRREDEFALFEHPIKGNPFDLIIAFEKVLLKFNNKTTPRVVVKAQKITIQHKMDYIKKKLGEMEQITLQQIIVDCASRYELIVLIMALLELCKANHVSILQATTFSEIEIKKGFKFFDDASTLQDIEAQI